MNHFLIPFDFSTAAENAFDYACKLALSSHTPQISLLHVLPETENTLDVISVNQRLPKNSFRNEKSQRQNSSVASAKNTHTDVLMRLEKMVMEYASESTNPDVGNIDFNFLVRYGNAADMIAQESQQLYFDMIVMAGHSAGYYKSMYHSSTATQVLTRITTPLLIVPEQVGFKIPKKMLFALDYQHFDKWDLRHVESLARHFKSELTLLYIKTNDYQLTESEFLNYRSTISELNHYGKMSLRHIEGTDFIDTIDEYIRKYNIDYLAMVSRKGWQQHPLYHKSLSRMMSNYTRIPLLVFHQHD